MVQAPITPDAAGCVSRHFDDGYVVVPVDPARPGEAAVRRDVQASAPPAPSRGAAREYLLAHLAALHPAYFALVMATGIVAISSQLQGLQECARLLSWINLITCPVLGALYLARLILFPRQVLADCTSHQRAPGFFTLVAATGVVGAQSVLLHGQVWAGQVLWWVGVVLWGVCIYAIFALLTVRSEKPDLAVGINGGWLTAVVATQAIAVLGCVLNGEIWGDRDACLFVLICFWLGGGMLYLWIIGLIFYRYMFFRFSPTDLMPPYWINMGAMAISTLAGALLYRDIASSPVFHQFQPGILGLTMIFWATATWWIPMLIVLGVWRHVVHRVPLTYDPLYWGLVFPFGMYSACTFRLSEILPFPFLVWIAHTFVTVGIAVWLLTFFGLAGRLVYAALLALRRVPAGLAAGPAGATRAALAVSPSPHRAVELSHMGGISP